MTTFAPSAGDAIRIGTTALYFSASDNSDPRSNGRRYDVRGEKSAVPVRVAEDQRDFSVVPAFVGEGLLPASVLQTLEDHPEAPGKSSWGTRNILSSFVLSMRPRAVLEIGAHIGSASVAIAAALRANRSGKLYCLEPQDHYYDALQANVRAADLGHYVRAIKRLSVDPALLTEIPPRIEMIFLDANHSYSHVMADLLLCEKLLADNGLLLLDDVGPEMSGALCQERRGGVRQALIDFAHERPDWHVIFLEPPFWLNPCGLALVCRQKHPAPSGK